jgi:hypothetical protein
LYYFINLPNDYKQNSFFFTKIVFWKKENRSSIFRILLSNVMKKCWQFIGKPIYLENHIKLKCKEEIIQNSKWNYFISIRTIFFKNITLDQGAYSRKSWHATFFTNKLFFYRKWHAIIFKNRAPGVCRKRVMIFRENYIF